MSRFKRKSEKRKQYPFIYIFTEGEQTERIYFEHKKMQLRSNDIKIEIEGTGKNTMSLVDSTLDFIEENHIDLTIDECWVVFDKDDFDDNFDEAIYKARESGIKVAYSNESFELWFLLHFDLMESAIRRQSYARNISKKVQKETGDSTYKYNKSTNIPALFELIKDKEGDAIRNAKKLEKNYDKGSSFKNRNPSTTVYELVERLNDLKK